MSYEKTIAANKRRAKHGMAKTKTYSVWRSMKDRCANPSNHAYPYYGGRGISVCPRWDTFDNFLADMGIAPDGMTLDRIDNNLGYSKHNCRWVSRVVQSNNIRTNTHVTHEGRTQTLAQWSRELNLPYSRLVYRHAIGWQPPELFASDNRKGTTTKHKVMLDGNPSTIKEVAEKTGTPLSTVYSLVYGGQTDFTTNQR